jgi:RNA polymerase sigma factor (sigma-70 family)
VAVPSPGELVSLAAAGDQAAWDALVDRFARLVWSIARSYRLGAADAADVSQTCWLRLVEHLDRLSDPERVGSWLGTTARRECLAVLRKSGRVVLSPEIDLEPAAVPGPEVESALLTGERNQQLWTVFATLSDRCQALLRLLSGDPPAHYDTISNALDMPVGSIGPTRARCLERLRDKLSTSGINHVETSSGE